MQSTREPPQGPSVRGCYGGVVMKTPSTRPLPKVQTPGWKAGVQGKPCCLYRQFR